MAEKRERQNATSEKMEQLNQEILKIQEKLNEVFQNNRNIDGYIESEQKRLIQAKEDLMPSGR
jgi:septum formation topological specificity factor MinE